MKKAEVVKGKGFWKRFLDLLSSLFSEKEEEKIVRRRVCPVASRKAVEVNWKRRMKIERERVTEEEYETQFRQAQRAFRASRPRRVTPRDAALMQQAQVDAIRMQNQMTANTVYMQHMAQTEAMRIQQQADNQAAQQAMNSMNNMNGPWM